jgi:hypothetical protein
MSLNQKIAIILLATFSGFIGGFISNELFSTKPAFAKKEPKHQKVIIAEEFRLVDKKGILRARLGFDPASQQTELGLSSPKDDSSTAPQILLSAGSSGGFLRIDGGTPHDIFAYRAILSAHEGQAKLRIGRTVIPLGNIELSTSLVGNNIVLRDNHYNKRAIIGKMDLKSKNTWIEQGAPFFSILLLDEKGNVLWSAE